MAVTIKNKTLTIPILQGGMGVGVSLEHLAGAVAHCGGMGTISSAFGGYQEPDFAENKEQANLRALTKQIKQAKEMAEKAGMIAVNIMVATTQYADSVRTALKAGVDAIVCGAGLPSDLPGIAKELPECDAALAPVVSSGRSAKVICQLWDRRYQYTPDFIVLEGIKAGGHLGFSYEEAKENTAKPLSQLLQEVLAAINPFKEKYQRDIPVFVAGGIETGAQMAEYMKMGAAGVQIATSLIATKECDASEGYKNRLLQAKEEDITIVKSPVGLPGRALNSPLIQRVAAGVQPKINSCKRCLVTCDVKTAPYCISQALISAVQGDWENGLFFCGANAGKITRMSTVKEQFDQIIAEWRNSQ